MEESNKNRDKGLLVIGALLWILLIEFIPYIYPFVLKAWGILTNLDFWTNSFTDWLQAIWGMGSLFVAWLVGWIGLTYSKNSEIQNRIAFEQSKPEIKPSANTTGVELENVWTFEAAKMVVYYKGIGMVDGTLVEATYKDDSRRDSFIFSQHAKVYLSVQEFCPLKDYFSCIVLYSNYASGMTYFKGFNYAMWDTTLRNIGEEYVFLWKNLPSPMKRESFEDFIKKASLKEQVEWRIGYEELEAILDERLGINKK